MNLHIFIVHMQALTGNPPHHQQPVCVTDSSSLNAEARVLSSHGLHSSVWPAAAAQL